MNKTAIPGKFFKLFLGFLLLNFLLCFSCSNTQQNSVLSKNQLISNTNSSSENSGPELAVQKFMKYVSENKLNEANDLIKTKQEVSGTPKVSREANEKFEEAEVKFDWAQAFKERNFSLHKIVSSNIFENDATVKALLNFNEKSSMKIGAVFSLKDVNGQWFIYDIDLITDGSLNR